MFNAILIFVSLLLSVSYDLCRSNISPPVVVPKIAVVKIRANVSFQCIVNLTDFPFWKYLDISDAKEVHIVLKNGIVDRLKSRYRTNNSSEGPYVVIIDHVDHEHAGRYICEGRDSVTIASAELTVIDSDPVCGTSTMANETIRMWCEINSTGNLIPSMNWTKDNDFIENITTQRTEINGSTTTTMSLVRLQLQPQDNNAMERITVKCTTSFMWQNSLREDIPYYEHVWEHTLTLQFANDGSSTLPEESIPAIICVSSIAILILIVLCVAFQRRKKRATKEAKINASSTTSTPNSGSEAKPEDKNRLTKRQRQPKRQTKDVEEHGTENVDDYENIEELPATSMQSETYCEPNLPEQGKPQTKPPTSAVSKDKKGRSQAIGNYEMLASRPSAAIQAETYCELQIMEKSKRKEKKT